MLTLNLMEKKRCWRCRALRSVTLFHKNQDRCRHCQRVLSDERRRTHPRDNAARRAHYALNRGAVSAARKAERVADTRPYLIRKARERAKGYGFACELIPSDIVIPERCPVLGIPLFIGSGRPCDNSPTIDRIDNSRGYVVGNIRVISWRANRLKSDATVADLERLLAYMRDGFTQT